MTVRWLAIDRNNNNENYENLKRRGVVAQGWRDLGDMTNFIKNNRDQQRDHVIGLISNTLQQHFNNFQPMLPARLYNYFFTIQPNDILVALEGLTVRGVCSLPEGVDYSFCADENIEYAHEFGPVEWIDWNFVSPDWTPTPPGQGILVIANAINEGAKVADLYHQHIQQTNTERKLESWAALLKAQKQIIFTGPPGTGKTLIAKRLAAYMLTNDVLEINKIDEVLAGQRMPLPEGHAGAWDIVQFHPSYNYDDFICGIRIRTDEAGQTRYTVEDGPLLRMAKQAAVQPEKKFILIVDEINRANVAAVLGEMIYALEYRGRPVALQYGDGNAAACLPENLYIIGTMNTADRSIGHIDYAVRRRFAFVPLLPDRLVVETFHQDQALRNAALAKFDLVATLFSGNQSLLSADYRADDVQPGHSYFLAGDGDDLHRRMRYQVGPLLREYVADGVLKTEAMQRIIAIEGDA